MNEPSVSPEFLAKLKKFDKNLGIEWMSMEGEKADPDAHWCIIDESKIIRRYKVENQGLIEHSYYKVIYDRLLHLKPGQPLNHKVFEQLWKMDKERWGREDWLEKHLNIASGENHQTFEKEKQDFRDAMKSELKTFKRFGVTVPGRKEKAV